MDIQLCTTNDLKIKGCTILPIFSGKTLSHSAREFDKAHKGIITNALAMQSFSGELESSLFLPQLQASGELPILLIGCGKLEELNASAWNKISTSVVIQLKNTKLPAAHWYLSDFINKDHSARQVLQQGLMAINKTLYQFEHFKSSKAGLHILNKIDLVFNTIDRDLPVQLTKSLAILNGMNLCKDLGNTPSNICTPTYLAEQAKELSAKFKTVKTTIIDEKQMKKLGMNAFLAVSKGSAEPPQFVIMEYFGAKDKNQAPHALVGKGITFDSGGISIKPSPNMDEMKFDMCGAASVLGTIHAIAEMKLPINVVGVMAASENLPGSTATKPGDIVTSLSGKTIEILNTDAEGRLVLCDALTYIERYKPASVIDIATLTGAIIIALGHQITGLMSNSEEFAQELIHAGQQSDDPVWYLPMNDEYEKVLESNFADMANVDWDRSAGSIVAGCFLSKFMKNQRWAHLDIAGTAWNSGKSKGATGRPIPLLVQYLVERCHDTN